MTNTKTEGAMAIEKNARENILNRAYRASARVREVSTALDYARLAENFLLTGSGNRTHAPDPSTEAALRTAVRLLTLELHDCRKAEAFCNAAADGVREHVPGCTLATNYECNCGGAEEAVA